MRILGGADDLLQAFKAFPQPKTMSSEPQAIDEYMDALMNHLYDAGAVTVVPRTQLLSRSLRQLVGSQRVVPANVPKKEAFDKRFTAKSIGQVPGGANVLFVELSALPDVPPSILIQGLSVFTSAIQPSQANVSCRFPTPSNESVGQLLPQIHLPKKLPVCAGTPGRTPKAAASTPVPPFQVDIESLSSYTSLKQRFGDLGASSMTTPSPAPYTTLAAVPAKPLAPAAPTLTTHNTHTHSSTLAATTHKPTPNRHDEEEVESKMTTSPTSFSSSAKVVMSESSMTASPQGEFKLVFDPTNVPFCPEHTNVACVRRINRKPYTPHLGEAFFICPEQTHENLASILGGVSHPWISHGTFKVWEAEVRRETVAR